MDTFRGVLPTCSPGVGIFLMTNCSISLLYYFYSSTDNEKKNIKAQIPLQGKWLWWDTEPECAEPILSIPSWICHFHVQGFSRAFTAAKPDQTDLWGLDLRTPWHEMGAMASLILSLFVYVIPCWLKQTRYQRQHSVCILGTFNLVTCCFPWKKKNTIKTRSHSSSRFLISIR